MTQLTVEKFLDRYDIELIETRDEINLICDYYGHEGEEYGFLIVASDSDGYTEVYGSDGFEHTTPKSKIPLIKIL